MPGSTQLSPRHPQVLFCLNLSRHQPGVHFVLGGELLFQLGNAALQGTGRIGLALKGCRALLTQLFLPTVKDHRLNVAFIGQIGYGHLLQEMAPDDGHLLLWCEMSLLSSGRRFLPPRID